MRDIALNYNELIERRRASTKELARLRGSSAARAA